MCAVRLRARGRKQQSGLVGACRTAMSRASPRPRSDDYANTRLAGIMLCPPTESGRMVATLRDAKRIDMNERPEIGPKVGT